MNNDFLLLLNFKEEKMLHLAVIIISSNDILHFHKEEEPVS